jgi:hypothetical protein
VVFFIQFGQTKNLEAIVPVEAITIIALSIYFFYEQLTSPDTPLVYMQARFWVVIGYLIYTAGTFFLTLYFDSLPRAVMKEYYVINNAFLIVKTILLSIAVFMKEDENQRNFN